LVGVAAWSCVAAVASNAATSDVVVGPIGSDVSAPGAVVVVASSMVVGTGLAGTTLEPGVADSGVSGVMSFSLCVAVSWPIEGSIATNPAVAATVTAHRA
jgi:hypothetical protein